MSDGTEIYVSRFKSPPRGRGPSPSDGGSFSVESDPPHGVDSPQDRDPTGIHPDEINENKKNEMNERDKKNGKLITSGQDMNKDKDKDNDKVDKMDEGDENKVDKIDEGDKNSKKTTNRKSKRIRSPNKELFPQKPPAEKKAKTTKNQNEHLPPRYQTTRHIHVGKHINHGTKKKKNKICIDCKDTVVEECWMCGREEYICEKAFEMKSLFEGYRKYPFRKEQLFSCKAYIAAFRPSATRKVVLQLRLMHCMHIR